jgi:hypothetical protein
LLLGPVTGEASDVASRAHFGVCERFPGDTGIFKRLIDHLQKDSMPRVNGFGIMLKNRASKAPMSPERK